MGQRGMAVAVACVVLVCGAVGCGTTNITDTPRSASEMLLVSGAVDNAIAQIDCSPLIGRTVYLDVQYLDKTLDKGYLISSLRQHLLAHGAKLRDEREEAEVIVETRSGAVGTDRYSMLLLGTPAMSVPVVITGQPSQIPEISLIKKTDLKGVAKVAVFAYERKTGEAIWQSGLVDARSTLKDLWIMGAGPFSSGSIRRRTEFAGEELPRLPLPFTPIPYGDPRAEGQPPPGIPTVEIQGPELEKN